MDKLNELVEMAELADSVGSTMDCVNPHDILAIAEAFRKLEHRAESAEEALNTWRKESAYNLQGKNDAKDYARELEAQLAELAKQEPIGWIDPQSGNICLAKNKSRGLEGRYAEDYLKYSQPIFTRAAPAEPVKLPGISELIDAIGCMPNVRDVSLWDEAIKLCAENIRAAGYAVEE